MGVDVAAAQQGRDLLAFESRRIGKHRRKAGRAGAFDDRLFDADEHRHRAFEVALGDQHDVVGRSFRIREVSSPGCLTAMPSASVSPPSGIWQPWIAHFIDG